MLFHWLPGPLRGTLSFLGYLVNTLFWCVPLFLFALLKALIPIESWRRLCTRILDGTALRWIELNNLNQRLTSTTRWEVRGLEHLSPHGWYMVVANHQSWVDILVLQRVFHGRIPFLKFFLKKELFWFPIMGLAWWALDFPFMKRYSRAFLKKHPHLAGRDLEITRRACEKFKTIPVSIMNFVEGTRFTKEKHSRQRSPYTHLLRTKAGGIAFAISAMGQRLDQLLDVTIVYPQGVQNFWAFMCGQVPEVQVRVRTLPIGSDLRGDYFGDRAFRRRFQTWLNGLWTQKDAQIEALLQGPPVAAAASPITKRHPDRTASRRPDSASPLGTLPARGRDCIHLAAGAGSQRR
ncbi:MAG: acyltransferase [Desulfosarcinaceae bacterium]|nr:acyltransferase [Desulfosarcinaceae bacterium]